MKYKNNIIHVLHMCTAYCKCQPCGLTSAGRGHIKNKYMYECALPGETPNMRTWVSLRHGIQKCRIKSGNCEGRPNHWGTVFTHQGTKVTRQGAVHIFSLCFECIWCNKVLPMYVAPVTKTAFMRLGLFLCLGVYFCRLWTRCTDFQMILQRLLISKGFGTTAA